MACLRVCADGDQALISSRSACPSNLDSSRATCREYVRLEFAVVVLASLARVALEDHCHTVGGRQHCRFLSTGPVVEVNLVVSRRSAQSVETMAVELVVVVHWLDQCRVQRAAIDVEAAVG